MQTSLLGEHKEPVECKESYGGFEVLNSESIEYKDISPKLFRSGEMITKQFDSYEEAKDSFEKQVRECYGRDVKWMKSKFQDSEGVFWLDGVKIKWELKTFYITTYHLEFNSDCKDNEGFEEYKFDGAKKGSGRVINLLTSTGYRSDFPSNLDSYDSVKDYIKDYLHYTINCDDKGKENKRLKEYRLDWEDTGYNPSKQFTLIEMKGGKK